MRYITHIPRQTDTGSNWVEFGNDEEIARITIASTVAVDPNNMAVGSTAWQGANGLNVTLLASTSKDVPGGDWAGLNLLDKSDVLGVQLVGIPFAAIYDPGQSAVASMASTRDAETIIDFAEPIRVRKGEKLYLHNVHGFDGNQIIVTAVMTVYTND